MSKIYVVGGAVRDELLGLVPKDRDYVVVGSSQEEMLACGYKQVGADFPVFLHPETNDEYALARVERKTGDGYLGFKVETEGVTLEDDLSRRDLTINAMAKPVFGGGDIVDPHGGQKDLKAKVLRHVSPAFAEDPLRVVRIGRFLCRFDGFTVAKTTQLICTGLVEKRALDELSIERFWAELAKVFSEPNPEKFFEFIRSVGADSNTKFFNGLYGPMPQPRLKQVMAYAREAAEFINGMMLHTAMCAVPDSEILKTADKHTQTLAQHVALVRSSKKTAADIFQVLKQTKAWGKDRIALIHLALAMRVMNAAGEKTFMTAEELMSCVLVSGKVTSQDFPDVKGKDLGDAIDAGRRQAIAALLLEIEKADGFIAP